RAREIPNGGKSVARPLPRRGRARCLLISPSRGVSLLAKSNFQKGGAKLPLWRYDRQVLETTSIRFRARFGRAPPGDGPLAHGVPCGATELFKDQGSVAVPSTSLVISDPPLTPFLTSAAAGRRLGPCS